MPDLYKNGNKLRNAINTLRTGNADLRF